MSDRATELIDDLLQDYKKPEDILGENGLLKELTRKLLNRTLQAEMTNSIGYKKNSSEGKNSGNSRNGVTTKKIKTGNGEFEIEIPRDRNNEYEPLLVQKGQRRFTGFDDKVLALYSRGMSTRDIQKHLYEIYNTKVSPDLISTITDEIISEVKEWQGRALEEVYAVLYLDALWFKVKENSQVINKAANIIMGITLEGKKDVLGIWIERSEGAKYWLKIVSELKSRGVKDVLIACVDGLKGFPEAIESVYPETQVQLCIVHMVRNSLKYVPHKDRKAVARDLKEIYNSPSEESAKQTLEEFKNVWDSKYPTIGKSWENNWTRVSVIFNYSSDIRKVIYTTNAIESLNCSIRKVTKNKRVFPTDGAALKIIYMAIKNKIKTWTMPIHNWNKVLNQFSILFEDRIKF